MYAHLFKKSFIINLSISTVTIINFKLSDSTANDIEPFAVFDKIIEYEKSEEKEPVFFIVKDELFNPILKQYCIWLGIGHDEYKDIIEQNYIYDLLCVKLYESTFEQRNFFFESKDKWPNITKQEIPTEYHKYLPLEYWVNYVFHKPEITREYMRLLDLYNENRSLEDKEPEPDLMKFIRDPHNNMGYEDEFSYPMFNKRLMLSLMNKGYLLKGEPIC